MRRHLIFFLAYSLLMVGRAFPNDSISASEATVLRSDVQKLEGQVIASGLQVISTEKNEAFRLVTHALGREDSVLLSGEGRVQTSGKLVSLVRPRLTEEYSVSTEGLRQDFVLQERPAGSGPLRLRLKVEGAACESIAEGVKLVLEGSGREIAYSKLKVTDARGREHTAMMHAATSSMIEIVVADEAAAYPLRIDPTLSDADWVSLNNDLLGTDGTIYCFVDDGAGNLYAGGRFSRIGGITTNNIARWDGTRWWPVGGGVDGVVRCMAFTEYNPYFGGGLFVAGEINPLGILRWDGVGWQQVAWGLAGTVHAIAVDGAKIVVGGSLSQAGAISCSNIVSWDGSEWSQMGAGFDDDVYALRIHEGNLYAGGKFTASGGVSANFVARWNGSSWLGMGGVVAGPVKRLLVHQGSLLAGGEGGLATWDGFGWNGMGASTFDLASDGTNLYSLEWDESFMGKPRVYNRSAMGGAQVIGELEQFQSYASTAATPIALAWFQGGLMVSGHFNGVIRHEAMTQSSFFVPVRNLARWSGADWRAVSNNLNQEVACMVEEGGQVVIGGNFTMAGGVSAKRIAIWNGTAWQALGAGIDKRVIAVAKHGVDVYAAEIVESQGSNSYTTRVLHWNGASWQPIGGMFNGLIRSLLHHNGSLYAAGDFFLNAGNEVKAVAQWNGAQWVPVGTRAGWWTARAMVVLGGDLYVAAGVEVLKWNGQAWNSLSGSFDAFIDALAVHEGQLLAGGLFTSVDGRQMIGLARWNGAQWSAFPSWSGFDVMSIVSNGAELYVATSRGGVNDKFPLHQWNGSAWKLSNFIYTQPPGGSSLLPISSMVSPTQGQLWIAGNFEFVGNTLSPFLIQANIPGSTLSTQETWRQTHFGTYSNAGNSADTADFDLDGLPNLLEYAFGLNPTQGVSRALPVPQVNGSNYVLSFTQPMGVSGVTYGAEWSTTLAPGSWVSIPNTGTAPQHTFSVPLSGNSQVFVRLKVATP